MRGEGSRLITKARGSAETDDREVTLYQMAFCDGASIAGKKEIELERESETERASERSVC